jgi:hypothetical protein
MTVPSKAGALPKIPFRRPVAFLRPFVSRAARDPRRRRGCFLVTSVASASLFLSRRNESPPASASINGPSFKGDSRQSTVFRRGRAVHGRDALQGGPNRRAVRLKCEYVQNVHILGMQVNHDGLLAKRSCGSVRVRVLDRNDDPRLDQLGWR